MDNKVLIGVGIVATGTILLLTAGKSENGGNGGNGGNEEPPEPPTPPSAGINGVVWDNETNLPLADVLVAVEHVGDPDYLSIKYTNSDGIYSDSAAPSVWMDVYVLKNSYYANGDTVQLPGQLNVGLVPYPMDMTLLNSYQGALSAAWDAIDIGLPEDWVAYVPIWGGHTAQWVADEVPGYMTEEAIRIGLIASAGEAYFTRDHMYRTDDDTLIV